MTPVGAGALARDVEELRHVLEVEFQVEVAALAHDALLAVGPPRPGGAGGALGTGPGGATFATAPDRGPRPVAATRGWHPCRTRSRLPAAPTGRGARSG